MVQKFNYDYADEELARWVEQRLEPLVQETMRRCSAPGRQARLHDASARQAEGFLFFNNHYGALAPKNARTLMRMLRAQGHEVV